MSEKSAKSRLIRALEDADVVLAAAVVEAGENEAELRESGMEVAGVVCGYLSPGTEEALPHLAACCQSLLTRLAAIASAKELLVALLEQLDSFQAAVCVRRVMPALSLVLTRLRPRNMSHSWSWALSTLATHFSALPAPSPAPHLQGKERLLVDNTQEGLEICVMLEAAADCVEPLVPLAVQPGDDGAGRKAALQEFLLRVMGAASLVSQHTESGPAAPPPSHASTWRLVQQLAALTSDPWAALLGHTSPPGEEAIQPAAVAACLYLVQCEGMAGSRQPAVYSPQHLLYTAGSHCAVLLASPHPARLHKGLLLLYRLLAGVEEASLPADQAGHPALAAPLPALTRAILHSDQADYRQLAFSCYKLWVGLHSPAARYRAYTQLLATTQHSGLLGWTISSLKETVRGELGRAGGPGADYTGPRLASLARPLFKLANGPETDLLELSEEVLATVNLACFLCCDRDDRTGAAAWRPDIRLWAAQLQEGLNMSTAHYEQRLREPGMGPDSEMGECSVVVGGQELPRLGEQQQRQVLQQALNTFSLIQFNLVRLTELLDRSN